MTRKTSHRRVEKHLLLTTDCEHCHRRIVSAPQLGWAHTAGPQGQSRGAIAALTLMCPDGSNTASPELERPIVHAALALDDDLTMAEVVQDAIPLPMSAEVLDDTRATSPIRGFLVAMALSLAFWATLVAVIVVCR